MATNKVVYGDNTLIDLTNDSVTPESLLEGVTAHDRSGAQITGSLRNLGHTILSKLGTPMNARANLSFGNANVTDDETNDVTKVDIQNIEPITQEAYNQLTQVEKNAHPWFITNATSFGGVYLFQTVALMEAAVQAGTVPAGAVMMTGVDTPYVPEAEDVVYDNTESELEATNAQNAIDEIVAELLTKQNSTDSTLSTSSKTVVGAINELYGKMPTCYNFDETPYSDVWGVWLPSMPSSGFPILDFTPPYSGKYLINLAVGVNTNDTPGTETYIGFDVIYKATGTAIRRNLQDAGGFYRAMTNMSFIAQLTQGQTITIYFYPRNLTSLRLLRPDSSYAIFFG